MLLIRNRVLSDVEKMPNSPLKEHLKSRYSHKEGQFEGVLDKSAIDGAIYIDTDMRNLMLTILGEGGDINGFKGSIARGGLNDTKYILFGKGLFIWDPSISKSMENRKVRLLMGESAAKNFTGLSMAGTSVIGRKMVNNSLEFDLGASFTNNHVIKGNFEGIGLRFGGH